jgi:AcrR family transcriptional regulator
VCRFDLYQKHSPEEDDGSTDRLCRLQLSLLLRRSLSGCWRWEADRILWRSIEHMVSSTSAQRMLEVQSLLSAEVSALRRRIPSLETRRRQVAEAALRTIAEDGVARFTTRAVAGRVGISDGTLFRHFGSKEEIVLEAMGLLGQEIDASLVNTGEAMEDLRQFFHHRARFVGEEGSVGRLIFSHELVHLAGDRGRQEVAGWRRRSTAFLQDRLGQLQQSGHLRQDIDIPAMSMLVQGTLLTFAMQASLGPTGSPDDLLRRIDHTWSTLQTVLSQSSSPR